jgi:hypothetical protein
MNKAVLALVLAGFVLPSVSHAQVMIDMTRVACADYLALPPEGARDLSAWMSGWFNQKKGYVQVDLDAYARNVANVRKWCEFNPKETLIGGLQRATEK